MPENNTPENKPVGNKTIDVDQMPSERSRYLIEIDRTSERDWNDILGQFDDANLWQTWSYGALKFGEKNLSHVVLRKHGKIVSAAQVAILSVPFVGKRFAYIKYGPMRRAHGEAPDADVDPTMLRAIIENYVERKRYLLRIMPRILVGGDYGVSDVLQDNRVTWKRQPAGGTFLIDLTPTAEALFMGLKPRWRNDLRRAQERDFEIVELDPVAGLDTFMLFYKEMLVRKRFVDHSEIALVPNLQAALPQPYKLKILACLEDGEVCAMNAYSAMGDTGISLYGVTTKRGRNNSAYYVLSWRILTWLKDRGFHWYDLGGASNPNVNMYKRGFVGKNGTSEQFVGKFDMSENSAALRAFLLADKIRQVGTRLNKRIWR